MTMPVNGLMIFQKLHAKETLNREYQYEVEFQSDLEDIGFDQVAGNFASLRFCTSASGGTSFDGPGRVFSGYISRFMRVTSDTSDKSESYYTYRMTLVPWTWFLGLRQDSRIFNSIDGSVPNTVKDILGTVFSDAGFSSDYSPNSLSGTYPDHNYVVQFNETDLDFMHRMLEREGIYTYFEHSDSSQTMILADSSSCHEANTEYGEIPFRHASEGGSVEHISGWERHKGLCIASYIGNDYDPFEPSKNLLKNAEIGTDHAVSGNDWYEYPGRYTDPAAGENYATIRSQEHQASTNMVVGSSNSIGIIAGYLFDLVEHEVAAENTSYLVVQAEIHAECQPGTYRESDDVIFLQTYSVQFKAIESATQTYRPPRLTSIPRPEGPHTAVVVGQDNEEITTDEQGRVKVQFHWDRVGQNNQDSSCWVRVMQNWAHGGWGSQFIPRHGMEVIVEYIDADLEKPIITGCVYNGSNLPPFTLPADATQSGMVSRSSKSGSAENANMLVFEDKKDEELLFVQAEKNAERVVKNNDIQVIGTETKDPGDQTITIHNHRTVNLVEGDDTLLVEAGSQSVEIGTDQTVTIANNQTLDVGADQTVNIGANQTIDVGETVTLTAGTEILFETGSASIKLESSGDITISGVNITIEGSGDVAIDAGANGNFNAGANNDIAAGGAVSVSGATGTFDGGGNCTVKGAIVNIN